MVDDLLVHFHTNFLVPLARFALAKKQERHNYFSVPDKDIFLLLKSKKKEEKSGIILYTSAQWKDTA